MVSHSGKLTILDVGHGNCAILQSNHGVTIIDTGPGSHLLEYLTQEGIQRIDTILISHSDKDHIGGLAGLLAQRGPEIRQICLNTDAIKRTDSWDDILWILDRLDLHDVVDVQVSLTRNVSKKNGIFDQGPVRVEILGPSIALAAKGPGGLDRQGRKIEHNSISAVIRLSIGNEPIALLPGDLDEVGLDDLLNSCDDIHAPILVYPHHGGRSGRSDPSAFARRLCELVRPETVVFSIGRGRFRTPRPEVVETIRQHDRQIRIACTQLSKRCAVKVPNLAAFHLNPEFSGGRETRVCCAGTLVIDLDAPRELSPSHEEHLDFIRQAAPLALCQNQSAGGHS